MSNRTDAAVYTRIVSSLALQHNGIIQGDYPGQDNQHYVDIMFPNVLSAALFAQDINVYVIAQVRPKRPIDDFDQVISISVIKDLP